MFRFPIGVILESFRLERSAAISAAAELGAAGIQMYATMGENAPENLTAGDRRALRREVEDAGLVFSALCGDLGQGFGDAEKNSLLIEKSKRILDLANDLGTNIITTHIGVVPEDPEHPRYQIMQEACFKLADYAKSHGSHFAVETGPEPAGRLRAFLDSLGSDGVAVHLDPANLRMVIGEDPVESVRLLAPYIVHTHAKDGVKLKESNPEYVYRVVHPIPEECRNQRYFEEVPLGMGAVPFPAYLKELEAIGYRGFLTIEREVGDNPIADIRTAFDYLKKVMADN